MRLLLAFLASVALLAQQPNEKSGPRPYQIKPDYENIPYGPHERNVLDFWKAKSDHPTPLVIHIHGGGFVQGDKSTIPMPLLRYALDHGISVATINYRYSTQAPYPAPMEDGAHAVQFLRSKAREWNIDPNKFAASGGSAGAGILMWIGFSKDMADPSSSDPVRRQSTRLQALGPVDGQSTYDPREIEKLVGEETAKIGPIRQLVGLKPGQQADEHIWHLYEEASPITHVSANAPPVFMYYTRPMRPLPVADSGEGIHNPRMGYLLQERMQKLGRVCEVHLVSDYHSKTPAQEVYPQMVEFFVRHFKEKE